MRYPWQRIPGYSIQFEPISDAPSPGFYGNTTFTWGQAGGTSVLYVYPGETVDRLAGITAFEIGHEVDAAAVEPQGGETQIENILGIHPASWAPDCDCAEQGFLSGWYAAAFSNYWSPGVGDWSDLAPEPTGATLAAIEPWLEPDHPLTGRHPERPSMTLCASPRHKLAAANTRRQPRPPRRRLPSTRPLGADRMTKIALVPSSYPPSLGGVEELTRHLALNLVDAGDEVEVWTGTPVDTDPETAEILDGLVVRRLPMPLPATNWPAVARTATVGRRTLDGLRQAVAAFRPDVLHVQCFGPNGTYATWLSRRTGIPLVVTLQGETLMDDADIFEHSRILRASLRQRPAPGGGGDRLFGVHPGRRRSALRPGAGTGPGHPERRGHRRGRRAADPVAASGRSAGGPALCLRPRPAGAQEGIRPLDRRLRPASPKRNATSTSSSPAVGRPPTSSHSRSPTSAWPAACTCSAG